MSITGIPQSTIDGYRFSSPNVGVRCRLKIKELEEESGYSSRPLMSGLDVDLLNQEIRCQSIGSSRPLMSGLDVDLQPSR